MKLKLQKFNPDKMKPYRIILLVGRRGESVASPIANTLAQVPCRHSHSGTGKSVLTEDLMRFIASKIDFAVAMTPTEESATMFRKHMPPSWIFNAFTGSKIDQLLNMQRDLARQKKDMRSLFVVLDDCMYDKKVLKSVGIRDIFMNGR